MRWAALACAAALGLAAACPTRAHQTTAGNGPAKSAVADAPYLYAFAQLYHQLKMKYPCAELKGIDWEAVGRELLRATAAKDPMWRKRGGSRHPMNEELFHPVREAAGRPQALLQVEKPRSE